MLIINDNNMSRIEELYGVDVINKIQNAQSLMDSSPQKQKSLEGYFDTAIHLKPVNVHFEFLSDSHTLNHNHDFYKLIYALDEPFIIFIDNKEYLIEMGEGILICPFIPHMTSVFTKTGSIEFFLKKEWLLHKQAEFEAYDSDNYLSNLITSGTFSYFSKNDSDEFRTIIQKLVEIHRSVYRNAALDNNLRFEYLFSLALVSLTKCRHTISDEISAIHESNSTAARIIDYIHNNYATTSIDDIAEHFGYSKTQIHRIIKSSTGTTVSFLILSEKMRRAKLLLLNSSIPIDAIALELGYENPDCFSKTFKRLRGITPYQYRKHHPHVGTKNSLKR